MMQANVAIPPPPPPVEAAKLSQESSKGIYTGECPAVSMGGGPQTQWTSNQFDRLKILAWFVVHEIQWITTKCHSPNFFPLLSLVNLENNHLLQFIWVDKSKKLDLLNNEINF